MRFLLAAVIIQDIGLPLDSNHSGELIALVTTEARGKAVGTHFL